MRSKKNVLTIKFFRDLTVIEVTLIIDLYALENNSNLISSIDGFDWIKVSFGMHLV